MADYFYYNIMRKTIVQVLDIFNNIRIAKYDKDGAVVDYTNVPLKFAPKTKQWYFKEYKRKKDGLTMTDTVFPMMALNMTSIDFAKDRLVNNLQKITAFNNTTTLSEHLTPIPYDFHFTLEVVTKYIIDMIQIFEQILPWFDPFLILRIDIPELNISSKTDTDDNDYGSNALELRVLYDSITTNQPTDIDLADLRTLNWNFDITVKGFLFQPVLTEPAINKIVEQYYTDTETPSGNVYDTKILTNTSFMKYDADAKILFNLE